MIDRIKTVIGHLKFPTFQGGIHPEVDKELNGPKPSLIMELPQKVRIPLVQHIGRPARSLVQRGDMVKTGQVIGEATGFVSSRVHASISGKVSMIKKMPVARFKRGMCIEITSDGKDEKIWENIHRNWRELSRDEIREYATSAGIVGMGGAAFPTHVKLTLPPVARIDHVIINGVECEPYLDCDRSTMCHHTRKVVEGLHIIMKMMSARQGVVGIELNKPDAIEAMKNEIGADPTIKVEVMPLFEKYPQGGEKQLISAVTGREIPAGGLPLDVGCLVVNAGTALAIYEAVVGGKPLISRNVTVAGNCLKESVNVEVRIGTMISDIVDWLGGFSREPQTVILGGPMMGQSQFSYDIPIIKGTSGVLFFAKEKQKQLDMMPCIRCGKCVDVCPVGIDPAQICQAVEFGNYALAEKLGLRTCIKCGCCSYVCPAKRELVQLIEMGEHYIKNKDKKGH
ncbi:electron transport complex subunit RsxC [bacterium]|nr:electron transport complex subunit RsxC [bacterium]MCP5462148.1 electron transport complex subunit RsxC [bacterium]